MSETPELDEIKGILSEYQSLDEADRYGRLECLAKVSVLLDQLARKDQFGPGAVSSYANILS